MRKSERTNEFGVRMVVWERVSVPFSLWMRIFRCGIFRLGIPKMFNTHVHMDEWKKPIHLCLCGVNMCLYRLVEMMRASRVNATVCLLSAQMACALWLCVRVCLSKYMVTLCIKDEWEREKKTQHEQNPGGVNNYPIAALFHLNIFMCRADIIYYYQWNRITMATN